jgi:hypothetical protein
MVPINLVLYFDIVLGPTVSLSANTVTLTAGANIINVYVDCTDAICIIDVRFGW